MSGALLSFIVASGLTFCAAILFVAVLVLRTARRYVDLAEERLERLREDQAHLLALLDKERRGRREDAEEREREEREREEQELNVSTSRGAERSIERSKRELLELRRSHRRPAIERERASGGSREGGPETRRDDPPEQPRGTVRAPRPAGIPETRTSAPVGDAPEGERQERPRVAVYHPHPDDDVTPVNPSPGKAPEDSPVQMFRVFYDRYLDNYEGYVKLAGRLLRAREGSDVVPGSPEAWKLEERLARVNDGIERTVSRLDILEEYNPELATDDRISRRANIAHGYAQLQRND